MAVRFLVNMFLPDARGTSALAYRLPERYISDKMSGRDPGELANLQVPLVASMAYHTYAKRIHRACYLIPLLSRTRQKSVLAVGVLGLQILRPKFEVTAYSCAIRWDPISSLSTQGSLLPHVSDIARLSFDSMIFLAIVMRRTLLHPFPCLQMAGDLGP